ncbi:MAG: hypothetical protein RL107_817 [Actinomycetota bacterium]
MHFLNLRRIARLVALGTAVSLSTISSVQAFAAPSGSPFDSAANPVIQISSSAVDVPYLGDTLDAHVIFFGGWVPTPTTMTYQWLANGKPVKKATGTSYTLTPREIGKLISVRVVGFRASYVTTTRSSNQTNRVAAGRTFASSSDPVITGIASVGQMLSASVSPWSAPGQIISYSYQWFRNGKAIKGATEFQYFVASSKDHGKIITVRVTGSAPTYLTVIKTSLPTDPVTYTP